MPDDDIPTEEERREAEALARALERGHAAADLPEDALETAHLLRYSHDGGALGPDRRDAILADVLEHARPPERRKRSLWLRIWLGLGAATAAAAAIVLFRVASPEPPVAAALPDPPKRLLRAQANATTGRDLASVDSEMKGYRIAVYDALEARYRR